MITASDLTIWASQELRDDYLVFDKILDIYEDIDVFLGNNNLQLNCSKQEFLMHLFLFIHKNSDRYLR